MKKKGAGSWHDGPMTEPAGAVTAALSKSDSTDSTDSIDSTDSTDIPRTGRTNMTRVTVIGGGYGGIAIAKALDDVAEVTLVEQKDTFVNHTAALRAAVDREWAERIFLPYDNLLARGRVVHGTALGVRGTTVSVAGMGDIEADHLVLATGTAYPFPAKHLESSSIIAKARIERAHTNLEQAGRVLIAGAGEVGIELAGEITSAFPATEVVMLEAGPDILHNRDYKPELREAIRFQLEQRDVEIITEDQLVALPPVDPGVLSPFRVTTKGGRRLEADMWFRAYGSAAATGFLGENYDEIRHYDGTIRVDDHLRVVDHPGVWAIGDITTCARPNGLMPPGLTRRSSPPISAHSSRGGPPRPSTPPSPSMSFCRWVPTAVPPKYCGTVCVLSSALRRPLA